MTFLHIGYRRVAGTASLIALALLLAFIAPAGAAPFGGPGYAADCALDIQRSADPSAYYLQIGFDSAAWDRPEARPFQYSAAILCPSRSSARPSFRA